jgi:uncharacterized membrane protein
LDVFVGLLQVTFKSSSFFDTLVNLLRATLKTDSFYLFEKNYIINIGLYLMISIIIITIISTIILLIISILYCSSNLDANTNDEHHSTQKSKINHP